MKSKKEIKQWILKNCVSKDGNIWLDGLDFSDFEGDVNISNMKVKKNLVQENQKVGGYLYQSLQNVGGCLYQSFQNVGKNLEQFRQTVDGKFITQKLKDNEKYELNKDGYNTIVKIQKKLTKAELIDILKNEYGIEKK
ncbi:MAG: hypothetical protein RR662_05335 [Clostridia bacterium]